MTTAPANMVRVRVPEGLGPGDSFMVAQENGKEFKVIVPKDALPGSEIEFAVPGNDEGVAEDNLVVKKTAAGAAVAGAVVGTILLGPVAGVLLAGGAAYATT